MNWAEPLARWLFSGVVFFSFSPLAFSSPATGLPASPVSMGGVFQVFFGLAVVLATVALVAWLLKRLAPGHVSAGGTLKLVGGIAIGPKERVVVVEIGDTWLVLGVAPGQVTALHQLPKIESDINEGFPASPRFAEWLGVVMKRRGAEKP
jgi:flagellar protein FliO/FliZ